MKSESPVPGIRQVIQVTCGGGLTNDSASDQGSSSGGGEKWPHSGYIF